MGRGFFRLLFATSLLLILLGSFFFLGSSYLSLSFFAFFLFWQALMMVFEVLSAGISLVNKWFFLFGFSVIGSLFSQSALRENSQTLCTNRKEILAIQGSFFLVFRLRFSIECEILRMQELKIMIFFYICSVLSFIEVVGVLRTLSCFGHLQYDLIRTSI